MVAEILMLELEVKSPVCFLQILFLGCNINHTCIVITHYYARP